MIGFERDGGRRVLVGLVAVLVLLASSVGSAADDGADAGPDGSTAAAPAAPALEGDDEPLSVTVAGARPFVEDGRGGVSGLSVELWRAVAARLGLEFELTRRDTVPDALVALERGETDVVVGPVTITAERARRVSFTQPYFAAGLGIVSAAETSVWERLLPLVSRAFVAGVGGLLLVLTGVGATLWLFERKKNPEMFPPSPLHGIGNAIWFALVTMTTVGYGDRVPSTVGGRVVAGAWMVIAMLSVSSLTAGIATTLTVLNLDRSSVSGIRDLEGRKVAVVAGTPGVGFARSANAVVIPEATVTDAMTALARGRVAAVVHDRPILRYALSRSNPAGLVLASETYEPQSYGFAIARGSRQRARLDAALLGLREAGRVEALERRFLDAPDGE